MRFLRIAFALVTPFALAVTLAAQSLDVQLQRAAQREAATGDHKTAIAEYRRIAERAGTNRAVAAQALLRLADAHREQGDAEAGKVYQRIVSGFADQAEIAALAQSRLASSRTPVSTGVAKRRVWFGTDSERVDDAARISPDGRFLAFAQTDSSTLVIRDLKGQTERTLVPASGNRRIETLAWSRDVTRIAIRVREPDGIDEIRIVTVDSATSRTLLRRPAEYLAWWVADWAPDGRLLVAVRGSAWDRIGLVWINSSNATIRPITEFPLVDIFDAYVSPDGTTIAFGGVRGAAGGREIHLVGSEGGNQTVLSADPRDSYPAGWLPGNREVIVVSQRGAKVGLWALPVARGPGGEARPLEEDLCSCGELVSTFDVGNPVRAQTRVETLGVTTGGDVFFRFERLSSDIYLAPVNARVGDGASEIVPLKVSRNGSNWRPQWSPDGSRIALFWNSVSQRQLSVIDVNAGTETRLNGTLPRTASGHCWEGNNSILVMQRMPGEPGAFTRVDLTTSKETILFKEPMVGDTSCSADGRIVGYPYSPSAKERYFRVRNTDTGSMADVPLPGAITAASISPDGKQVAYVRSVSSSLFVQPIDGRPAREIARTSGQERFLEGTVLAWSSDGQYVYYVKHRNATSQSDVFRARVSGGEEQRLGITGRDVRNLSVSPDGSRIAFVMGPRNRPEIWAIENTSPATTK
jgi:Tol biopolymer transport system component